MTNDSQSLTRAAHVSLRPITAANVRAILRLKVAPDQEQFVATNAVSLAQAHFNRKAWYRAIYADETPVGFIMLFDDGEAAEYFLWRLMIDGAYQGLGFGRQAVLHLIEYVRTRPGAAELLVSHVPGEGSPGLFYQRLGFLYTGEEEDGELLMRLPLAPVPASSPPPTQPLTHVVLFKLQDRSPQQVARAVEAVRSMAGKISTLRDLEVGANVTSSPRAYDLALVARFDSQADLQAYQTHPIHQEVLEYLHGVMAETVSVDYISPAPAGEV